MMDSAKSFLRGVMDVALVIIPLSVVLGIIFGPSVPFIGTAVVDNISALVSSLGGNGCLLYTSPSPRDGLLSRMPSSA